MRVFCLQSDALAGHTMNETFAECSIYNVHGSLCGHQVHLFVNKTPAETVSLHELHKFEA